MGLLDTMKKVAEQTGQAGVPTAFLFGTVTSTSPLVIRVDNRFNIGEKQIVLMKQFRPESTRRINTLSHSTARKRPVTTAITSRLYRLHRKSITVLLSVIRSFY